MVLGCFSGLAAAGGGAGGVEAGAEAALGRFTSGAGGFRGVVGDSSGASGLRRTDDDASPAAVESGDSGEATAVTDSTLGADAAAPIGRSWLGPPRLELSLRARVDAEPKAEPVAEFAVAARPRATGDAIGAGARSRLVL
jgi:hypothetical protein